MTIESCNCKACANADSNYFIDICKKFDKPEEELDVFFQKNGIEQNFDSNLSNLSLQEVQEMNELFQEYMNKPIVNSVPELQ